MNEEHREDVERETGRGNTLVWGMLPVFAGLTALSVLLYLYFPAPLVALSLVVIGFVVAGAVVANGRMHRTRRRG